MAASTLTASISGAYPTGENTSIVGLILGILEKTPFHPEGTFAIASSAVLAFCGFEIAKVLKHENSCFVLLCELDDATAHQMSHVVVYIPDLGPQIGIVLFTGGDDASL